MFRVKWPPEHKVACAIAKATLSNPGHQIRLGVFYQYIKSTPLDEGFCGLEWTGWLCLGHFKDDPHTHTHTQGPNNYLILRFRGDAEVASREPSQSPDHQLPFERGISPPPRTDPSPRG